MFLPGPAPARVLIALALLLAACGPRAPSPAAAPGTGVPIQVEHNLDLATSVTVYVIEPTGVQRRLGSLAPGQIQTFSFPEATRAGSFQLIAEGPPGQRVVSRPFALLADGVSWELLGNNVTPLRQR